MGKESTEKQSSYAEHKIPPQIEQKIRLKQKLCRILANRYFMNIGRDISDSKAQISYLKLNWAEDLAFRSYVKELVAVIAASETLSPEDQVIRDLIVEINLPIAPSIVSQEMILAKLAIEA